MASTDQDRASDSYLAELFDRQLRHRHKRQRLLLGGAAIALVVAIVTALAFASQSGDDSPSVEALGGGEPATGLYYLPAGEADAPVELVFPSGTAVELSGSVEETVGGLGLGLSGAAGPLDETVCCPVNFGVFAASAEELFDGVDASTTTIVSAERAKVASLQGFDGRYAVLSVAPWTLVASFATADNPEASDEDLLARVAGWGLEDAGNGARLLLPDGSVVYESTIAFGSTEVYGKAVELIDGRCPDGATGDRDIEENEYGAVGFWCQEGVVVRVEGPRDYVDQALESFNLSVASSLGVE
jgi:hypothetical protein